MCFVDSERILIVSLGSAGRRHLKVIRTTMPQATIMVFRHTSATEREKLADYTTCSFEDVRRFQPNLAVLANPASLHADIAIDLLSANCHLLIEKPLATQTVDGRAILSAAQATELIVRVAYNLRFLPSLQAFRALILQGFVGKVVSIRCNVGQFLGYWREESDYRQTVSAQRKLGGGVLLELSHELDYLAWIFGRIEWVSAWCGALSNLEIDVEDTAHLVLGLRQGTLVASVNLDFLRHDTTRSCIAICEGGSLLWDGIQGTVKVWLAGDNDWRVVHQTKLDPLFSSVEQWKDFYTAVLGKGSGNNSVAATVPEACHVLEVVDSARSSFAQNGARVDLPGHNQNG